MQEVEIIKSTYDFGNITKKIVIISFICALVFFSISLIAQIILQRQESYLKELTSIKIDMELGWKYNYSSNRTVDDALDKLYSYKSYLNYISFSCLIIGGLFSLLAILTVVFYLYTSKIELVVTNLRVYWKKPFGRRMDLPFDKIASVRTDILNSIIIATSSGKITFLGISNNLAMQSEINKILNQRQQYENPIISVNNTIGVSNSADEIKKYKDLLDIGVITQEEFEAKKKQLLNL